MELTAKRRQFVEEYLKDANGTQAAIRAGYSPKTANEQAARLLANASVAAELHRQMKARSARTAITADRMVEEAAFVAFVDPAACFNDDGSVRRITEMPEATRHAISSIKMKTSADGEVTTEIRFHNKVAAIDLLAKHLGLYREPKPIDAEDPLAALLRSIQGTTLRPTSLSQSATATGDTDEAVELSF